MAKPSRRGVVEEGRSARKTGRLSSIELEPPVLSLDTDPMRNSWFEAHAMPIFNRCFGLKPGPEAPRIDRLLWFRGYYLRGLPPIAIGGTLMLLSSSTLFLLVIAVALTPWIFGFARLNLEIRRERKPSSAES